ncbi:MAG: divalent-cation tolerance protein CutA [Candidatus Aminicenantales bacterium]
MKEHILVLTNVPDAEVGRILAEKLVEERLAACVTLSAGGESVYWWEGKISQDQEHTLFIKTRKDRFEDLKRTILEVHPYQVPEIIALPIVAGHAAYLEWLEAETSSR